MMRRAWATLVVASLTVLGVCTPAGALMATTVTGWSTIPATGAVGYTIKDAVSVRTGAAYAARSVTVQRRPSTTSTWSSVSTSTTTTTGAYTAAYTVPSTGVWYFRLVVKGTSSAASATTLARKVTGISGLPTTVSSWTTTATTAVVGSVVQDGVSVRTGSGYVSRPVIVQRRPSTSSTWSTVASGTTSSTGIYTAAYAVPATGVWYFRLQVPASATAAAATTTARTVTGVLATTTVSGWDTTATSVAVGATVTDAVSVVTGTGSTTRGVSVQRRAAGASTWTTVATGTTTSAGSFTAAYAAPSAGLWSFRLAVTQTVTASAATTAERQVTAVEAPAVTAVGPSAGDPSGGTVVTITGTHLAGASAVSFGGVAATGLSANSETSITVIAPAHVAGTVAVIVTTGGGTSNAFEFTYTDPPSPPTIAALAPGTGTTRGGTVVVVTGEHLGRATTVLFGGREATIRSVDSDSQVTVEAPPAATAGSVAVQVRTPDGVSPDVSAGRFTYEGSCGSAFTPVVDVVGVMTTDQVWSPECAGQYRLHGTVTVAAGTSLVVGPGTTIAADPNASLQVAGHLETSGATDAVTLTSVGDPALSSGTDSGAAPAVWSGVTVLDGGTTHLEGVSLRWAQTGVAVQHGGSAVITGSRLVDDSVGLVVSDGAWGSLLSTEVTGSGRGVVTSEGSSLVVDGAGFTGLQTGITLGDPGATVSHSHFDSISVDTIAVAFTAPVDPATFEDGNVATGSRINGVHLRNPVFADGARLFGRPGWGLVITNSYAYGSPGTPAANVPAGSTVTVPADAVVKFAYFDHWPNYAESGDLRVAGTLEVYGTLTKLTDDAAGGPIAEPGTYGDPMWGGYHFAGVRVLEGGSARALPGSRLRFASAAVAVAAGGSALLSGADVTGSGSGVIFDSGASGAVVGSSFTGGNTALNIAGGADVEIDHDHFTDLQTGISLSEPSTDVTNCAFDGMTADTIAVNMQGPFDPAKFAQGNVASGSRINGVHLRNPVFVDGARLFGRPGWGLVVTNSHPYGVPSVPAPNVPAGSTVTVPTDAVVKFAYFDHWPNYAESGDLQVAGSLDVFGTLTKLTDDSAGGPIAEPGTYRDPSWGNHFAGISVLDGGQATLINAKVRYANVGVAVAAGADLMASSSTFVGNGTAITVGDGGTVRALAVAFEDGGTGLNVGRGATATIKGDTFTRMVTGVSLSEPSTYVIDCTFDTISGDTIAVNVTDPYDPSRLAHGNLAFDSRVNGVQLNDTVFADGATLFGGAGWGLVLSYTSGNWWSPKPMVTAVPLGSSLTVPAGTVVKASGDRPIRIEGFLNLGGTPDAPVVFTSWRDSLPGGTTAGDGVEPKPGDWRGLAFAEAKADTLIENAVFRYASVAIDIGSLSGMAVNRTQFAYNNQAFAVASTADSLGLDLPCVLPYGSFVTGYGNYYGATGSPGFPYDLVPLMGNWIPEGKEKVLYDEMTKMYNLSGPVSVGDNTIPWTLYSCIEPVVNIPVTPILTPVDITSPPPFPVLAETP